MSATDFTREREGWQGERRFDQKRYHFIRNTESLCGRLIFYHGEIVDGGMTASESKDDCAACKRAVVKELARRVKEAGE